MKDKGNAVAVSNSGNWFSDYYSSSSDLPCKKHPSSSSVGICAYCLKDRLIKLVCSDCGEQRLSSCSCSDISSSYPNSCTVDIGSVGRISFLIENDKDDLSHSHSSIKSKSEHRSEATLLLKRSSSTSASVDVKKANRFWRFGKKLFRKKTGNVDEKGETWGVGNLGASRSRSVCGFRGGFEDSEGSFAVSTGRPSDLNSNNGHVESKKGNFVELDESFCGGEDPGFIDIELGLSSESKPEFSCFNGADFLECDHDQSGFRFCKDGLASQSFDYLRGGDGVFSNGSSCRITVNNNEMKKCKKSFRVWKWIVKHHSSSSAAGRPSWKKDEEDDFKH